MKAMKKIHLQRLSMRGIFPACTWRLGKVMSCTPRLQALARGILAPELSPCEAVVSCLLLQLWDPLPYLVTMPG